MDAILALAMMLTPAPAETKNPGYQPGPRLPASIQFGKVVTVKGGLAITGESWTATGHYREDGSLFLEWTEVCSGRKGIGVYVHHDYTGHWRGAWGWVENCNIDEHGNLVGEIGDETLYGVK